MAQINERNNGSSEFRVNYHVDLDFTVWQVRELIKELKEYYGNRVANTVWFGDPGSYSIRTQLRNINGDPNTPYGEFVKLGAFLKEKEIAIKLKLHI